MKIKHIGVSFGVDGLTDGNIYMMLLKKTVCIGLLTTVAKTTYIQKKSPHHLTEVPQAAGGKL